MARRKKRSSRHSGKSPIITYTVSVAHEPGSECDACAQPRPVLIEQEGGAWVCEICTGGADAGDLWRAALLTGVYSWGGDGL
jgi:hypothetical protein